MSKALGPLAPVPGPPPEQGGAKVTIEVPGVEAIDERILHGYVEPDRSAPADDNSPGSVRNIYDLGSSNLEERTRHPDDTKEDMIEECRKLITDAQDDFGQTSFNINASANDRHIKAAASVLRNPQNSCCFVTSD